MKQARIQTCHRHCKKRSNMKQARIWNVTEIVGKYQTWNKHEQIDNNSWKNPQIISFPFFSKFTCCIVMGTTSNNLSPVNYLAINLLTNKIDTFSNKTDIWAQDFLLTRRFVCYQNGYFGHKKKQNLALTVVNCSMALLNRSSGVFSEHFGFLPSFKW
jgi:hypothetical protein